MRCGGASSSIRSPCRTTGKPEGAQPRMSLNEDTLVQQTTADYLRDALGWRSEYAHNTEVLGPEGSFGRASEKDVVLTRILGKNSWP